MKQVFNAFMVALYLISFALVAAGLWKRAEHGQAAESPEFHYARAPDQTADHDRALALTIDMAQCRQDLDIARTARNQSFVACVAALPMSHPDMARLIEECAGVTHER